MRVTALIAEDEAPQRRALRELLASQWPDLDIIAECGDGLPALAALDVHHPRVAFLDIRMPGANGLDAAQRVCQVSHVVFTTAYDEHAFLAFEAGALDYLLKPITAERLSTAILRLHERLNASVPDIAAAIENLRKNVNVSRDRKHISWITAAVGNVIRMFSIDDVLFFKSEEKCTRVVTRSEEAAIRASLKELLSALDPNMFWQIHRSVIVHVRSIKHIRRNEFDAMEVSIDGCSEILPVSQAFQYQFRGM